MTGSSADTQPRRLSPAADLLYGSLSGMVGMFFQFPFDTLKVRLQTQPHHGGGGTAAPMFDGPLDCAVKGFRQGGFLSFYKGLSAPLVGAMIENSALFVAFNHIQGVIRRNADLADPNAPLSLAHLTLSGFLSGALVSFILTPVELVKCQLQVQDVLHHHHQHHQQQRIAAAGGSGVGSLLPPHGVPLAAGLHTSATVGNANAVPRNAAVAMTTPAAAGPWSVIVSTLRTHGVAGFYHGHVGTFLREAGGGAAWFGTYEFILTYLLARHSASRPPSSSASSSLSAPSSPSSFSSLSSSSSSPSSSIPPPPLTRADLPTPQIMLAGALAGMTYNAALFPADSVKSRQQTTDAGRGNF
ncbi:hypothetical protein HDU86_005765 [Geranomyces michiganensis]|nr:hypothetical protein HDU86_005765 [Geranomyces michiganensis]